ncbi:MAG: phosphotransferase family protein, partial [Steroidobacteraceae bacterium]
MSPRIAAEDALAVDPAGLTRYFSEQVPHYAGDFRVERLGEGQSCLTFMIQGEGWRVVLRRPPRGDLPPSAFDVTREFRVMSALHSHDAPVPVAAPIALCTDSGVIGAPFYLMEPVEGLVVRTELHPALAAIPDRERMASQLLETLCALQAVDYAAVGLDGFGKPDGYLARQLRRMNQLWELARFRDLPDIETVGTWLAQNMPEQRRASIVHGDYKLDNVIFAPAAPARLIAVVDWEMSTIGDPLADLGWMLYWWRDPGDDAFGLTVSSVMDQDGFPRRRELLERYVRATGEDVSAIEWYAALGGWKIAIIMEGSNLRFKQGNADDSMFAALDAAVPALAQRSLDIISGATPV